MRGLRTRSIVFAFVAAVAAVGPAAIATAKPPSGGGGGSTSGTQASFVDYAQCANNPPPSTSKACPGGWINGILNTSNSHYAEDQVTAQRMEVLVPAGSPATNRTLTIEYMTRKGGTHAYDSLATWNHTQTEALRCQGLSNANCVPGASQLPAGAPAGIVGPAANGNPWSVLPIPPDNTSVPPVPSGSGIPTVTSAHQLTGQYFAMYGGTLTGTQDVNGSPYVHTDPSGTGDEFARITVVYSVADVAPQDGKADAATKVQLLFGGHLAASSGPRGWGEGLGSSNISGGPYHIKFAAADGASIGNRDNQIMSSAILPGAPAFTITKTANNAEKVTVAPGATVNYKIVVTNTGTEAGSTTFVDDYDDRLTVTPPAGCVDSSTATNEQMTCTTNVLAAGGGSQTFEYSAVMPSTFSGSTGGGGCTTNPPQYAVINTVTLASGGSDSTTVCVTAAPAFTYEKTANPTSAIPGQVVTYTIVVTNVGSAPGSTQYVDDYDDRLTITPPAGCVDSSTQNNKKMTCTTGVISPVAPNNTQTFTYTAAMPETFRSNAPKCGDGVTFAVINKVLVNGTQVDDATVCVNANPTFVPTKTSSPNPADAGATVTYTLTITNNGTAAGSTTGIDDYDDRLDSSITAPAGCTKTTAANDPNNKVLSCTTGVLEPGEHQDFVYTAVMPSSFDTPPNPGNATTCPGRYTIVNRFTVSGTTATNNECVTANPHFTPPTKTPSKTTAQPGEEVQFTLSTTNDGDAPGSVTFTDVYDSRVTITVVPAGCTNNVATHTLTCTATNVLPGGTATFVYTARMPSSFTGSPGGGDCGPGEYPVINTVTIAGQPPASAEVCVPAPPDLHVGKTGSLTGTTFGDEQVYTITYSNTGPGEATTATITETVPPGTEFVSCTGGCTVNGNTVTWSVGPIASGGGSSVTMTVRITSRIACEICNTVSISSPQFNGGTPVSFQLCLPNSPTPDVANANANGEAYGVKSDVGGLLGAILPLSIAPTPYVSTSQHGPGGPVTDTDQALTVTLPPAPVLTVGTGGIATVNVLPVSSVSEVSTSASEARSTDVAEVADVCLLSALVAGGNCLIGTDLAHSHTLRSVAQATATGDNATTSAAGTTIEGLTVLGQPLLNVAPNTDLDLAGLGLVVGPGSYIRINEQINSSSTAGTTNVADLTVNMIHVHLTNVLLGLNLVNIDLVVAHAQAHADFPKTPVCQTLPNRTVSGGAVVLSVDLTPPLLKPEVGRLVLPSNGGNRSFALANADIVNALTTLVRASAVTSSTSGTITATQSHADSHAAVTGLPGTYGVCIVPSSSGTSCLVGATVARSEAHATANAGGASANDSGSQLVGLVIAGVPIVLPVPNNTAIPVPGLGFIVINERFCDAGSTLNAAQNTCTGTTHAGLTARALHVYVRVPVPGLPLGAEVVVAEAHADATFGGA